MQKKDLQKVREKIEQSGTDHRWEFDRKRLFESTNYMAKICQDLFDVAIDPERRLPAVIQGHIFVPERVHALGDDGVRHGFDLLLGAWIVAHEVAQAGLQLASRAPLPTRG